IPRHFHRAAVLVPCPPCASLSPYSTLFRSPFVCRTRLRCQARDHRHGGDVTATLQALLDVFNTAAVTGFVVFLRIAAAMAFLPGFGEAVVPVRVKLAVAIAFTAVVAPAMSPAASRVAENPAALFACLWTEPMIGLAIGVVLRLMVIALEIAGTIAAQSTSLSQLFGAGGEPMTSMSHLLVTAGLALAMMAGLHTKAAALFLLSYDVLPPGALPAAES